MSQDQFEAKHKAFWAQFEAMLVEMEALKRKGEAKSFQPFPRAYRQVCKHLSLAQSRCYSAHVVDKLNFLVMRGHDLIYRDPSLFLGKIAHFFLVSFPVAVRKERVLLLTCFLLFAVPTVCTYFAVRMDPTNAYYMISPHELDSYVSMHDPANQSARSGGDDIMMFGFYIYNNVGINFRTFAGGLLYCVGTIFFLVFNGFFFGCIAGYVAESPASDNFFAFVVGHSSFEMTALVLAGVAGMRFGSALLLPGQLSRREALRQAAKSGLLILYGAAAMTIVAAVFEAFWSPRQIAYGYKHLAGACTWSLTLLYLFLMGRGHEG